MKTKRYILITVLTLLVTVLSCNKDHEIPVGQVFNSESGGGNSSGGNSGGGNSGGGGDESTYLVSVSSSPAEGGVVTGGGTYLNGQYCTLTATANDGYTFSHWSEGGVTVSTISTYSFIVSGSRTLVAYFESNLTLGSGTADDPYNIMAAISLQGEQPTAWIQGYIVGTVKTGIISITSSDDINWSTSFDIRTNVVLADDPDCKDVSQCVVVNLSAGKPLRTEVNLMDHPENLGKRLTVLGTLRTYFGHAGLRDSDGTVNDFVLEEGTIPTSTEIFSESFATGQGAFIIQNVILPSGLAYVWAHDPNYQRMRASGYVGQGYETESWLVSPVIYLTEVNSATLSFDQAVNFGDPQGLLSVLVSSDYNDDVTTATWFELDLDQWPQGNNWSLVRSTSSLNNYVGNHVTIAFKYTSTTATNPTWEVKNIVVSNQNK